MSDDTKTTTDTPAAPKPKPTPKAKPKPKWGKTGSGFRNKKGQQTGQ